MQEDTSTAVRPLTALEQELPPRPRRRLLGAGANPVGMALLCVLLTACGFIGGVLIEKGQTQSSASMPSAGALASRLGALRTGSGRSGGLTQLAGAASAGGSPTVGQVAYVSGHKLYVTNLEGNTIEVTAAAGASVTRTIKSDLKAIHPGETVIVAGSAHGNGAIRAQSIRASQAASAGGALGGGLFGGGSAGAGRRQESSEGPVLFGK